MPQLDEKMPSSLLAILGVTDEVLPVELADVERAKDILLGAEPLTYPLFERSAGILTRRGLPHGCIKAVASGRKIEPPTFHAVLYQIHIHHALDISHSRNFCIGNNCQIDALLYLHISRF